MQVPIGILYQMLLHNQFCSREFIQNGRINRGNVQRKGTVFARDGGVSTTTICKRGGSSHDRGLPGWMISSGDATIKARNLTNKPDSNVSLYD